MATRSESVPAQSRTIKLACSSFTSPNSAVVCRSMSCLQSAVRPSSSAPSNSVSRKLSIYAPNACCAAPAVLAAAGGGFSLPRDSALRRMACGQLSLCVMANMRGSERD